jgi:hypothetical protein
MVVLKVEPTVQELDALVEMLVEMMALRLDESLDDRWLGTL